jgi:hypothetical protein
VIQNFIHAFVSHFDFKIDFDERSWNGVLIAGAYCENYFLSKKTASYYD